MSTDLGAEPPATTSLMARLRAMNPYRLGAIVLAVIAFGFALYNGRQQYFVYDEWAYWTTRRGFVDAGGVRDWVHFFFAPHNGHLQALVWMVWLPMDWLVGMNSYVPYLVPAIAVHAVAGVLLFEILDRRCRSWVALGAATLYLFMGNAASVTSFAFTLGETAPIAASLAALLAIQRFEGSRERLMMGLTLGAVLVALAAASGIGIVVLLVVMVAYGVRGRYRLAAIHAAVAGISYLLWSLQYETAEVSFQFGKLGAYASYVWEGLTTSGADLLQVRVGVIGVLVLGVAVAGVLWSLRQRDGSAFVYLSALSGAIAFYGLVAIRGVDLNPASYSADQGRYLYIAGAFMIPALAWVADRLISLRAWTWIPLVIVIGWAIPANAEAHLAWNDGVVQTGIANRVTIETAASIVGLLGAAEDGVLVADGSARIASDQLQRLDRQGKLPCTVNHEAARSLAQQAGIPEPTPDQVTCD